MVTNTAGTKFLNFQGQQLGASYKHIKSALIWIVLCPKSVCQRKRSKQKNKGKNSSVLDLPAGKHNSVGDVNLVLSDCLQAFSNKRSFLKKIIFSKFCNCIT